MLHEQQTNIKPSLKEWLYWAQVVIDRLTTCTHVYKKPPYVDAFVADADRQEKTDKAVSLLRGIFALSDDDDASSDDAERQQEAYLRISEGLTEKFKEVLEYLPSFSDDMQTLLKSPWQERCNGKVAEEFFRGPKGHINEGVGSGSPEHGRLPEVLAILIERYETGDDVEVIPERGNVSRRAARSSGHLD